MQGFRTGLKRAAPVAHVNCFAPLLTIPLPPVPAEFGSDLFPSGWGMLGNDEIGDCTIAGAEHIIMAWLKAKGTTTHFTDVDALEDYENFGYVPGKPQTDQGADMISVAQFWQSTGMRDWRATRYKIAAYASIEGSDVSAPNLDHVYQCAYLFGACGIGINLPDNAETQFDNNETWTVEPDAQSDGYHFVPIIGRGANGLLFVTWGKACWMSEEFFRVNCKEGVAYLPTANDQNANLFAVAA